MNGRKYIIIWHILCNQRMLWGCKNMPNFQTSFGMPKVNVITQRDRSEKPNIPWDILKFLSKHIITLLLRYIICKYCINSLRSCDVIWRRSTLAHVIAWCRQTNSKALPYCKWSLLKISEIRLRAYSQEILDPSTIVLSLIIILPIFLKFNL